MQICLYLNRPPENDNDIIIYINILKANEDRVVLTVQKKKKKKNQLILRAVFGFGVHLRCHSRLRENNTCVKHQSVTQTQPLKKIRVDYLIECRSNPPLIFNE